MTKEQMEILKRTANVMLMMAKAMQEAGNEECMKAYARSGAQICRILIQAEKEWDEDRTEVVHFPMKSVA